MATPQDLPKMKSDKIQAWRRKGSRRVLALAEEILAISDIRIKTIFFRHWPLKGLHMLQ